jgi:hypothetical protein
MPTRSISIREVDEALWTRAVDLAGEEAVAARLTDALEGLVAEKEAEQGGFEEVEINVPVLSANNWVVGMSKVTFWGKEVARRAAGTDAHTAAFRTRKGKLLIQRAANQGPRFGIGGPYLVHETLVEAREATDGRGDPLYDPAFLDEVARVLGEKHVEELDV